MSPPMSPLPRCHDDPNYSDVWDCSQWAGYACASGYDPVTTPERIALLMHSCPQSCTDSTPLCPPPPPSSPAFPQQPPPPPPAPPSPPRPPLHPRERLILPGSTLQSEVDAAPAGSVLVLAEGLKEGWDLGQGYGQRFGFGFGFGSGSGFGFACKSGRVKVTSRSALVEGRLQGSCSG
eukprot:1071107-Prymnesium_polylepis.1